MSCHAHKTEALSPYTFERSESEPTNTYTTQQQFAQRLRGTLARINAKIREAVGERDLFSLQDEALADDVPDKVFEFPTDRRKIAGFLVWLREQLDENFLDVVGPDRNQFIRKAYAAGIRNAADQLSELDVAFLQEDTDTLVGRPIHRSSLQELYTRAYGQLVSVRDDIAQDVRDTLLSGFREGKGPREIARTLTDRVDSIGKHRSTMIARSEVINAHSEGTLTTVEEANRTSEREAAVTHGEWDAANDSRTCAFCRALDGTRLTVSEMRNNAVNITGNLPESFVGRTLTLKPPAHPNGRCNISISIGATIDRPLNERLPNGIQA
jgi:hypothetical protein